MKKILTIVLAAVLFAACSSDEPTTPTEVPTPVEEETPVIDPVVTELSFSAEETAAAAELQGFNMDFFKAVNVACVGANENMVCSPMSSAMLLSMLGNITDAELTADIVRTLGCDNLDLINSLSEKLINGLPSVDASVNIAISNGLWYKGDETLNPEFEKVASTIYHMDLFGATPFASQATIDQINEWVDRKTKGWIDHIINEIRPKQVAVLANALYLKGAWANPFEEEDTYDGTFHGANGDVDVKMMHARELQHYLEADDFQAVRMELGSGKFNAYFVLPNQEKDINDFIASDALAKVTAAKYLDTTIDFDLPRYKFNPVADMKLNDVFAAMGVHRLDDFTELKLFMRKQDAQHNIFQKAAIEFNEVGAEGAAVTWDTMVGSPGPDYAPAIPEVHFNRPYVFFITEATTGSCLFAGKVVTL